VLAPERVDVRAAMAGLPGHATLVRASDAAKARHGVFHPEPAAVAALAAGLRARFDPQGILNPGRMAADRVRAGS
jgi:glycolate oxidase FAD binding subunit